MVKIKLLEKINISEPQEVIVTFLGTDKDESLHQGIYKIAEAGGSLDFLKRFDKITG